MCACRPGIGIRIRFDGQDKFRGHHQVIAVNAVIHLAWIAVIIDAEFAGGDRAAADDYPALIHIIRTQVFESVKIQG